MAGRPAGPLAGPVAGAAGRAPFDVGSPFGDAAFRASCTWSLRERLQGRPDWTFRRVAALCLCVADRLRERGVHTVPDLTWNESAPALESLEARLCR